MEQPPRNNFRGRYNGRGNYRGRGSHHASGQSHYNSYNNQRGQYRGRGRGRGGRHLNSNNYSTLHAKSFEQILEIMTGEEIEEHQVPSQTNREKLELNTAPKRNREDDLDEDIVYKYRSLIKIDTPEELARWIENRKKNFPSKANIEKKVFIKVIFNLYSQRQRLLDGNLGNEACQPTPAKQGLVGLDYGNSDSEPEVIPNNVDTQGLQNPTPTENKEMQSLNQAPSRTLKRVICKLYQQGKCLRGRECDRLHKGPQLSKDFKTHKHDNLFSKLQETEVKSNAPMLLQALRLLNLFANSDASH